LPLPLVLPLPVLPVLSREAEHMRGCVRGRGGGGEEGGQRGRGEGGEEGELGDVSDARQRSALPHAPPLPATPLPLPLPLPPPPPVSGPARPHQLRPSRRGGGRPAQFPSEGRHPERGRVWRPQGTDSEERNGAGDCGAERPLGRGRGQVWEQATCGPLSAARVLAPPFLVPPFLLSNKSLGSCALLPHRGTVGGCVGAQGTLRRPPWRFP